MQDVWQYSTVHNSACKVIEEQTLWGQSLCRIWLPNQDAVVRVPRSALRPLSSDLQPEVEAKRIAYVAAAAKVAEVLEGSTSATAGHVLLAPMESNVIPLPHQIHALSRAISGDRVRYLLGVDGEALIVSDDVPLITEDFRPTDGDAVGTLSFATPYSEGQTIVTALGIPDENADNADETQPGKTQMKWSVQPAIVREGGAVDVVFDQLALIDMGTETGLLLMLSEPATEE